VHEVLKDNVKKHSFLLFQKGKCSPFDDYLHDYGIGQKHLPGQAKTKIATQPAVFLKGP
jgi:hypothetical protein